MRASVIAAVLALAAGRADAQAVREKYEDHLGLDAPGVRVTGALTTEFWYDDNVLLSRSDEEDDFITVLVPELRIQFGEGETWLRFDYRGRDRFFADHSEFDGLENFLDTQFHVQRGAFVLDVWDSFQDRNDAFSIPGRVTRIDWLQHDIGCDLAYAVDSFHVELNAEIRRFELFLAPFDFFDHRRWQITLLGAYDLSERVQVLIEGGASDTDFDDDGVLDDFKAVIYRAGLRGTVTDDVQLTLKAGITSIQTNQKSGAADSKDDAPFTLLGSLQWAASECGTVKVEAQRRPVESIVSGWMLAQRADVAYSHDFTRITLSGAFFYEMLEESRGGEDRKAFGISGGASLRASKHLQFDLHMELRRKDSDDSTYEYDNLRGSLSATVKW